MVRKNSIYIEGIIPTCTKIKIKNAIQEYFQYNEGSPSTVWTAYNVFIKVSNKNHSHRDKRGSLIPKSVKSYKISKIPNERQMAGLVQM